MDEQVIAAKKKISPRVSQEVRRGISTRRVHLSYQTSVCIYKTKRRGPSNPSKAQTTPLNFKGFVTYRHIYIHLVALSSKSKVKMCHGHPHYHECQHTSVKWLYCPDAKFDLETGYETPCANPIYSAPQPSTLACPLQNCHYKTMRGTWTCCQCGHDANTQGWCDGQTYDPRGHWLPVGCPPSDSQTCGHGCCSKCIGNGATPTPCPMPEHVY